MMCTICDEMGTILQKNYVLLLKLIAILRFILWGEGLE